MRDKRTSAEALAAGVADGARVGIGGWGSRRKPLSLVRAICAAPVRDLTVVSFGGPDVGLLLAAGKVRHLICPFVTLDSVPREPHFVAAREAGELRITEYDEGVLYWALYAGALGLPFLPTRAGLGSDMTTLDAALRTVRSPYEDAEELLAVPALALDVALVHLHRADAAGNAVFLGPDLYFDDLFCQAARRAYLSVERVVATRELDEHDLTRRRIHRGLVHGVVEAPGGAGFTSCEPDYGRDEDAQRAYVEAARDGRRS